MVLEWEAYEESNCYKKNVKVLQCYSITVIQYHSVAVPMASGTPQTVVWSNMLNPSACEGCYTVVTLLLHCCYKNTHKLTHRYIYIHTHTHTCGEYHPTNGCFVKYARPVGV
jgi:hypothetical protein